MASTTKAKKSATASNPQQENDAEFAQQFRKAVIKKLDAWVDSVPAPDKPIAGSVNGGSAALSPKEIVMHVKKRTPTGEKLVANWAELVLRNIEETPLG